MPEPQRTVTVTLRAPVAQEIVMALSKGQFPTEAQREGRERMKQGLLDAGYKVDSVNPSDWRA
jgi:hypothetical protein